MPNVEINLKANDQGSAIVRGFGKSVESVNNGIKGAQASWQKYTLAIGAAVGVMAGAGAAARALFSTLNEGAQLELAQSRFENLAASIGTTADALTGDMARATQGMIGNAQLVASASDMISLGLADSGDEVVRLSNLVGQLGWDMQVLTLTMANDSMLRLDALGLSMTDVKARMEDLKAAGVAADEAFDMAVIEEGEVKLELLGSAADTTAGKIQQLTAIWTNATDAFKTEFAEGVAAQLDVITNAAGDAAPAIQEGLGQWGEDAGGWLGNMIAGAASEGLQRGTDRIKDQLRGMGVTRQELAELERQATDRPLPFIYDAEEGIKYYTDLNAALRQQYGLLLDLQALNQRDDRDVAEREAMIRATENEGAAVVELTGTYRGVTDQYWEMGQAQGALYGSYEYGQYVIEQQAAAVENLSARHDAYQAKLERYWEMAAQGGDYFMQQAGAEPADQIFNDDLSTNGDALNQLIIGIADNAGVGALGLADLNIQLGEMEPAAARAKVAATVSRQAIEILIGAWQGGEIDTTELLGSIDAVIAELQNKTLPEIEIGIKAKLDMGEALDIPRGEQRWMEMMGESPEIPIEAYLAPFELALSQALGQVAGSPAEGRTLQILANYDAVTTAATVDIPNAITAIPAEARTITFIPEDSAVQGVITALNESRLTVYVDFVAGEPPAIPGRAAGGPVTGGAAYVIGEAGPELFVPWTSGTVVPSHRVSQSAGASGVAVTMNFYGPTNAVDVRRAADDAGRRLLERVRRAGVPT